MVKKPADSLNLDQLREIFGEDIPAAAVGFIFEDAPEAMTIEECRSQITGVGILWKSLQKTLIARGIEHPFSCQGQIVAHLNTALFVAQSNKQANELTLLLNMGHKVYLDTYPDDKR